ncbi:cytochrome P450 [Clohesyomyces aquaticus]|uniref:Cytochrome P450 n=1 Tax=Clohesyomyces aquaticus TaxID=1231657 RepID=A0A1Y1ZFU5_9PLEO|nr:cytochrome P450 [Clohesyomyces aquaticus]
MYTKYGPIIRINSRELHIDDPDFYDEIYAGLRNRDMKRSNWGPLQKSMECTVNHKHHRLRRSIIAPYFSVQSVLKLKPILQEKIDKLVNRTREVCKEGRAIDLYHFFVALSSDVITHYAFGESSGNFNNPDFNGKVDENTTGFMHMTHVVRFFPFLYDAFELLPRRLARLLNPGIGYLGAKLPVRAEPDREENPPTQSLTIIEHTLGLGLDEEASRLLALVFPNLPAGESSWRYWSFILDILNGLTDLVIRNPESSILQPSIAFIKSAIQKTGYWLAANRPIEPKDRSRALKRVCYYNHLLKLDTFLTDPNAQVKEFVFFEDTRRHLRMVLTKAYGDGHTFNDDEGRGNSYPLIVTKDNNAYAHLERDWNSRVDKIREL